MPQAGWLSLLSGSHDVDVRVEQGVALASWDTADEVDLMEVESLLGEPAGWTEDIAARTEAMRLAFGGYRGLARDLQGMTVGQVGPLCRMYQMLVRIV